MRQIKRVVLPLILLLLPASAFYAGRQSAAQKARKFTLEECVNEFDPKKVEKTAAGYQYWFVDKNFLDGRTLKLSSVEAGKATHEPHRHAEDEFFFILEGKAEFYLDGRRRVVGPQTSLYCPPNQEHGIRNAGDATLKYLVVKKYEK